MANKKVSQLVAKPSVLVTDLFPIADPTTGQLYKTTISDLGTAIGSGVSSVNTLVGAVVLDTDDIQELASPTNRWFTDTRARAAVSASSPLAYNSGTGVFSIPAATSSQNGYLTSTDWTTFNAKQAALSGTGFVKISGTTISYDNSTYALDSAVVKLTGNQTIAGVKTFTTGIVADVTTGGTQGFASTNSSTSGSSIFLQNNSTSVGNAIGINNTSTADGISIGNDTSGRAIYISNATASGSGKGISIDNYNGGIGIEVGSDSTADAIKVLHLSGRAFNIQSSGGGYGVIINNTTASTSAPFTIQKQGANRITFTDAGAGTFVSTISAAGATLTGALSGTSASFSGLITSTITNNALLTASTSTTNRKYIEILNDGGQFYAGIGGNTPATIFAGQLAYSTTIGSANATALEFGTNATIRLSIASTGAATFSSSVTANGTLTVNEDGAGTKVLTIRSNWAGVDPAINVTTSNSLLLMTANTERMRITSAGNVGIGTTAPNSGLHINSGATRGLRIDVNSGVAGFSMSPNGVFGIDEPGIGNGRFSINTNGNVLVGTTTDYSSKISSYGIDSSSSNYCYRAVNTNGQGIFSVRNDGQFRTGDGPNSPYYLTVTGRAIFSDSTGVLGYVASVREAKTNINPLQNVSWIYDLNPVSFNYRKKDFDNNYTEEFNESLSYGLIADEVEKVNSDLVFYDNVKGKKQLRGVEYEKLVPALVKVVQELKAELDTLKNK